MEIKIGVRSVHRELVVETDLSAEQVEEEISKALAAERGVFTITDTKGRRVVVPVAVTRLRRDRRGRDPSRRLRRHALKPPRFTARACGPRRRDGRPPRGLWRAPPAVEDGLAQQPALAMRPSRHRRRKDRLLSSRLGLTVGQPALSSPQHGARSPAIRPTSGQGTAVAARGPHIWHVTAARRLRAARCAAGRLTRFRRGSRRRESHGRQRGRPQAPGVSPSGGHPLAVLLGQPGEHPADLGQVLAGHRRRRPAGWRVRGGPRRPAGPGSAPRPPCRRAHSASRPLAPGRRPAPRVPARPRTPSGPRRRAPPRRARVIAESTCRAASR